ncbi:hypothetical protein SFRURICE_004406, partial [Spodoptera frugiperda]
KKPYPSKLSSPPWWDSECTSAVKERERAEDTFNVSLNLDDFQNLQKISARTKRFTFQKEEERMEGILDLSAPVYSCNGNPLFQTDYSALVFTP